MTARRGFTLMELMVALVLFGLVVAGMFSVTVTMTRGFRDQDVTINTEAAARASMDMLAQRVRGASPAAPTGNIQHVNTCATGAVAVVDSATAPDVLRLVYASGSVLTSTRSTYELGTTVLTVTDASQLAAGDTLLISDLERAHLVTIASVDTVTGIVRLVPQSCVALALPAGGYPSGSLVIRARRVELRIEQVDGIATLMMDPDAEGASPAEPLAEGIEDLQIAVGVDADGDGVLKEVGKAVGDDEWAFNVAGEVLPAGPIRALRITLVARATQATAALPTFLRPAAENHPAATAADGFRRRSLTSTIELRNLQGSP